MRFERQIDNQISNHFKKYKQALILLGARQVGKTTLLKRIFPDAKYFLLDEKNIKDNLENYDISSYKQIIGKSKQIILDELHLLSEPGRAVKIIYDQIEDINIIVTGSSSLHIKNKTGESMAGRSIGYNLYPLTFSEYLYQGEIIDEIDSRILEKILKCDSTVVAKVFNQKAILNNILIYGTYPNLLTLPQDKKYLENLAKNAIFKDIVELNLIDNRAKALELLKLLAYQIGNLVSYSEIARKLNLNTRTVQRYIDIFEESYIIYRVYPFSKNKRMEIGKMPKVYFWDLGIRNVLIGSLDSIEVRSDLGSLFENFIINEVKKLLVYTNSDYKLNYWRLKSGAEVDIVLSKNDDIIGCEVKLNKGSVTKAFKNNYPDARTHLVNMENFY